MKAEQYWGERGQKQTYAEEGLRGYFVESIMISIFPQVGDKLSGWFPKLLISLKGVRYVDSNHWNGTATQTRKLGGRMPSPVKK